MFSGFSIIGKKNILPLWLLIILPACSSWALSVSLPELEKTSTPISSPTILIENQQIAIATVMPTKTITVTPQMPLEICNDDICIFSGHFVFKPPIGQEYGSEPEQSYPYGGTQNGEREPHHGVEFINPVGTPVLAVADGIVEYSGKDSNQQFGWGVNFYGNLVILQHKVKGYDSPIYTLYGHLSKVSVATGDKVSSGQKIGEVGLSGRAIGAHLHFEVREGINDYAHTINPEFWVKTKHNSGALAVQIFNENNEVRRYPDFKLVSLDDPNFRVRYPKPYADASLNGDDLFQEVMAVAGLPPAKYELSFSPNGVPQTLQFEIYPDKITRITFHTKY
jgi:hypothetical protein